MGVTVFDELSEVDVVIARAELALEIMSFIERRIINGGLRIRRSMEDLTAIIVFLRLADAGILSCQDWLESG